MHLGPERRAETRARRALATALGDLRALLAPDRRGRGALHDFGWTHLREALDRVDTAAVAAGFSRADVLLLLRARNLSTTGAVLPARLCAARAHLNRLRSRLHARAWMAGARRLSGGPRAPHTADRLWRGASMFDPLPERLPCIGGPFDGEGLGGWQHARDTYEVFRVCERAPTPLGHPAPRVRGVWARDLPHGCASGDVHVGSYRLDPGAREARWVPV